MTESFSLVCSSAWSQSAPGAAIYSSGSASDSDGRCSYIQPRSRSGFGDCARRSVSTRRARRIRPRSTSVGTSHWLELADTSEISHRGSLSDSLSQSIECDRGVTAPSLPWAEAIGFSMTLQPSAFCANPPRCAGMSTSRGLGTLIALCHTPTHSVTHDADCQIRACRAVGVAHRSHPS
jgi:hypothetical protein